MKFKKITAFAAAAMIAAGICTGVPTGTENNSPLAITAEAATLKRGKLDATVTYSGVSLDIKWNEVKNADQYTILVLYSTDDIPFATLKAKSFKLLIVKAGEELSVSIPTLGLPIALNDKPYHYEVQVNASVTKGNLEDENNYYNLSFDSLDDLEKTTYGNTDTTTTAASADAKTTVTGSQTYNDKLPKNYSATGGDKKIDVKWDKVSGAKSYTISYSNAGENKYKKAAEVTSTSYTINDLTNGAAYDIMIEPSNSDSYVVILNNVLVGENNSSKDTGSKSSSSKKLAAPTGFKTSKNQTKIALSWGAVEGADAYKVYMYNEKTGKYESYKNVSSAKCTISGLKKGTKYKFKVAALVKKDGKYVVQTASKAVAVTTKK